MDAKTWKDVYSEEKGEGGAMEATFTPVKCRYVRILGVERVNEDWGISIWEVEIFGPKDNKALILFQNRFLTLGFLCV